MEQADLLGAMKRAVEQLAAFNDIAKALTSTLEVNEVLDLIGDRVSSLLGADRWSLLLEGDDGMLHFEIAHGPGAEALKDEVVVSGEGIAGTVFASGKARLVADVASDPDFAPRFDLATTMRTRSALVVPLTVRRRVLGVLELVNGPEGQAFTQEDVAAATAVADFAAIAIDNARNYKKAQALTVTDEHTGLFNARHLRAELERELARCKRFARPLSIIFLDVDRFKEVNDAYGHLVGSAALKAAGQVVSREARVVDAACRYGGDEFAVLVVETGPDGARQLAQRVVEAFRNTPLDVGLKEPLRLTVSVGYASYPDDGQSEEALLEAADRAMYRAKKKGRDRAEAP